MLLAAAAGSLLGSSSSGASAAAALAPIAAAAAARLRGLSTATAAATATATAAGEAVALPGSADGAVLLRLPQRPYGAAAELPAALAEGLVGARGGARRIGVLREAFAAAGAPPQAIGQLIAPLGPGAVALAARALDDAGALVVDEYERDEVTTGSGGGGGGKGGGGGWRLSRIATRAPEFLARQGLKVALVPDVPAAAKAAAAAAAAAAPNAARVAAAGASPQSTNRVLMVAPTAFGFNEQAAQDNAFMHAAEAAAEGGSPLTRQVLREFAGLYRALTETAGVSVSLMQHSVAHGTPDACFPNNWISTHAAREGGGPNAPSERTLVLYPMKCPNRAAERRADVIGAVQAAHGPYARVLDMSAAEKAGGGPDGAPQYFEGTGVLVLDRVNGVAYVNLSERAHEAQARAWAEALGYNELVTFRSTDAAGRPVYHTNVMMAVGTGVAVVCADSVADPAERARLLASLARTHEVVQISHAQMGALCGNALELQSGDGLPVMAMSTQAYNAFTEDQRRVMRRHVAALVHAPIDTLERVGGGGVRCALAELF